MHHFKSDSASKPAIFQVPEISDQFYFVVANLAHIKAFSEDLPADVVWPAIAGTAYINNNHETKLALAIIQKNNLQILNENNTKGFVSITIDAQKKNAKIDIHPHEISDSSRIMNGVQTLLLDSYPNIKILRSSIEISHITDEPPAKKMKLQEKNKLSEIQVIKLASEYNSSEELFLSELMPFFKKHGLSLVYIGPDDIMMLENHFFNEMSERIASNILSYYYSQNVQYFVLAILNAAGNIFSAMLFEKVIEEKEIIALCSSFPNNNLNFLKLWITICLEYFQNKNLEKFYFENYETLEELDLLLNFGFLPCCPSKVEPEKGGIIHDCSMVDWIQLEYPSNEAWLKATHYLVGDFCGSLKFKLDGLYEEYKLPNDLVIKLKNKAETTKNEVKNSLEHMVFNAPKSLLNLTTFFVSNQVKEKKLSENKLNSLPVELKNLVLSASK